MAFQTPSHGSRRRTRQTPLVSCQGGISSTPAYAGVACRGLGGRRHFPGRHFLLRRCLGEEGVKYLLGDAIGVQVQPATLVDRRSVLDEGVRHADSVDDDTLQPGLGQGFEYC